MLSRKTKLFGIAFLYAVMSWVWVGTAAAADGDQPAAVTAGGIFDEAPAAEGATGDNNADITSGQSVKVGSFGQIDLHVKELDLTRVLQLLSIQSQRNIIASRNVAGSVSADLYGVDFYDALDAILQPNGFGFREKGQFIYVYTAAELQAIEDAERKLTHRVVRLNYLTADDASVFVTPLLSQAGSISVSSEPKAGIQPSVSDAGENSFSYADTLIIRDYQENVDEIVAVINELDIRPKQVLIEATVLEAQLEEDNAFGVDFSILVDMSLSDFVRPLNVVDQLIGTGAGQIGEGLQSTVGNTLAGDSGFKFGVLEDDFAIFLRALDRVTDTTVVANPKLLVLNRQRADLLVGAKLGYLSTTATETATTQTVDFLEVGTQLSVRPFVSSDDFIRLELKPSISDGTTTAVEGVVIPNETTEEMTTNVLVRNGQTVVMGGLFKEDTTVTRNQVPGLGDLPLAGPAFKGYDDETSRSEVLFLIKSTVMKDDVLYELGERASDNLELTRIGAREGLLPWSRSKMTAGHIRKAVEEHGKGNLKKARWWVNLALSLDPRNLEARRIKEMLTGERIYWPQSSTLIEAIDKTVDMQLEASAERAQERARETRLAREAARKAKQERIAARQAAREQKRQARTAPETLQAQPQPQAVNIAEAETPEPAAEPAETEDLATAEDTKNAPTPVEDIEDLPTFDAAEAAAQETTDEPAADAGTTEELADAADTTVDDDGAVTELPVTQAAASDQEQDTGDSMAEAIEASQSAQERPELTATADDRSDEQDADSEGTVASAADEQDDADGTEEPTDDATADAASDSDEGSETATVDVIEAAEQWAD